MKLKHGRLAMRPEEAKLLAEICSYPGDHLEIGVLWGATSIIAALNKPKPGALYAIDIMSGGFWVDGDPGVEGHPCPTIEAIIENFTENGVNDRITLIRGNSHPLPIPESVKIATALIDGGHGSVALTHDWDNLSGRVEKYIAIHDYKTGKHPGVESVVEEIAMKDTRWKVYKQAACLIVLERVCRYVAF